MAEEFLTHPLLGRQRHGFFTRRGGASQGGPVAGLQTGLGADDDPGDVARNRDAVCDLIAPGATLLTPYQVHSPDCVIVDAPFADRPRADALATRTPGLLLGIVTADCAPVLLADEEAGVIAAAHAGWRGAQGGVIANTIRAMEVLGAQRSRIAGVVGPAIAQASYEVAQDMRGAFDAEDHRFFAPGRGGHFQFDLAGYVLSRLEAAGVAHRAALAEDTYTQPARFYSYRRATHRGEATYGRQISVIALAAG